MSLREGTAVTCGVITALAAVVAPARAGLTLISATLSAPDTRGRAAFMYTYNPAVIGFGGNAAYRTTSAARTPTRSPRRPARSPSRPRSADKRRATRARSTRGRSRRASGAAAQVLQRFFGTDRVRSSACSYTLPAGRTCADKAPVLRQYRSFSQAKAENGTSRVLVGFHFRNAVNAGITHGTNVADWKVNRYLQPL
ncbi:hypothetical protein AB0J83_36775 [Actinoplanes sp. NPDC049596]|uniref:hypothetical protein n=1 Tax=unclassified Actinoplanes TaxID=2626549 RepID=UPI0034327A20